LQSASEAISKSSQSERNAIVERRKHNCKAIVTQLWSDCKAIASQETRELILYLLNTAPPEQVNAQAALAGAHTETVQRRGVHLPADGECHDRLRLGFLPPKQPLCSASRGGGHSEREVDNALAEVIHVVDQDFAQNRCV
jgi:hypothetical protein